MAHVCPWWLAFSFDNWMRKLIHNPEKIFGPWLENGQTALDIGCGMGFFTRGLARIVGPQGRVTAVDLQTQMLEVMKKRAEKKGVLAQIEARSCGPDSLGLEDLEGRINLANMFWMVHEVPDRLGLFRQVHQALAPGGKALIAEPKLHVSESRLEESLSLAAQAGFKVIGRPQITFSRAALLEK